MFFTIIITLIVLQRIFELFLANRNSSYLKAKGAYEVGQKHYKYIVLLHVLFFVSLIFEVALMSKEMPGWVWLPLTGFVLVQVLRIWTISTLGSFWNTRIIILPEAKIVTKGPYRFLRHPNYFVVILEFIFIPLMFQAYFTMALFSLLNLIVLSVRISVEERALTEATDYATVFSRHHQFKPQKN